MSGIVGIGIKEQGSKQNLPEELYNMLISTADLGEGSSGLLLANEDDIKKYSAKGVCSAQREIYNMLSSTRWEVALGINKKSLEEEISYEAIGPIRIRPKKNSRYSVYISFDGFILDPGFLRNQLEKDYSIKSEDHAEIAGALFHGVLEQSDSVIEAARSLEERLAGRGFYSAIFLINKDKENIVVALRSSTGTTPLCYGQKDGLTYIASESNGLDVVQANFIDFVQPGWLLLVSKKDFELHQIAEPKPMMCSFQAIYFGSPDAYFTEKGQDIFSLRKALGACHPFVKKGIEVNAVSYIPMTGAGLAEGLALSMNKPSVITLKKNLHTVKTFNIAEEDRRKAEIVRKLNPIKSQLQTYKVLAVAEDSIVRGGVLGKGTAKTLFNGGAEIVHFVISYGPIFWPCPTDWFSENRKIRVAWGLYNCCFDEINKVVAEKIGLDNKKGFVHYNSWSGLTKVLGSKGICYGCIDGKFPVNEFFMPDWLKAELEHFHKVNKPYFDT